MIVINYKLAKEAMANATASGRVTLSSSEQAYLLQALIHLNYTFDVKRDPSKYLPKDCTLDDWSGVEVAAAETINWLIAFLERLKCKDIERLLSDVSAYRAAHPDYPRGAWPFEKRSL